jgi:hypothetical protein
VRRSRSANSLGYRCIIQAAEKFANLAQRFGTALSNHPHRHVLCLQRRLSPGPSKGNLWIVVAFGHKSAPFTVFQFGI